MEGKHSRYFKVQTGQEKLKRLRAVYRLLKCLSLRFLVQTGVEYRFATHIHSRVRWGHVKGWPESQDVTVNPLKAGRQEPCPTPEQVHCGRSTAQLGAAESSGGKKKRHLWSVQGQTLTQDMRQQFCWSLSGLVCEVCSAQDLKDKQCVEWTPALTWQHSSTVFN